MVLFTCKRKLDGFKPIQIFGEELQRLDQVKYSGVILDSKLTCQAHLMSKYNKALSTFWQCKRIVGKIWGIAPKIAQCIYVAIIRPMSTVWWLGVELRVAKTMLGRLQHLECLAITGAIRTTPMAATETLSGLPSLDIYITGEVMNSCYHMTTSGAGRGMEHILVICT